MRQRRESSADEVAVLSTGDRAAIALAQSVLDSAGIRYEVRNDLLQDLFAWGRVGGFNFLMGPARVLVSNQDAEAARELLKDLSQSRPALPDGLRLMAGAVLVYALVVLVLGYVKR